MEKSTTQNRNFKLSCFFKTLFIIFIRSATCKIYAKSYKKITVMAFAY